MRAFTVTSMLLVAGFLVVARPDTAEARLTSAQKRELSVIRRDLTRVRTMLRKDEVKEAEETINGAIEKLTEIAKAAMVDAKDPSIAGVLRLIQTQRAALLKAKANAGGEENLVSFEEDIAPILKSKCGNCHGERRAQGGLNLATFTGFAAGGQSRRPLVSAGNPAASILMQRLTTNNDQQRMPRGQAKLGTDDLEKIAIWITQGAKFDGKDRNAPIGSSANSGAATEIAMATGNEKVSFTRDIAPWMANICMRCHGGGNPRSGFSVATFQSIMKGGDSGRVVIPGNPEASRMYRLIWALDEPVMPQGNNVAIRRKNAEDLKTWILEGAKFDGDDATKNIRELVPTEAEAAAVELAKLSPEEFVDFRKERADELWDAALEKSRPGWAEAEEVYVFGSVGEERLVQVAEWAEAQATALRKVFGVKGDDTLWKGKLTIFVTTDRFDFDEFVLTNTRRRAPRTISGMTRVTSSGSDAYIVLEDVGDDDTGANASLRVNVLDYMTGAFLERKGGRLPEWVKRGTGLAVAAISNADDPYIASLRTKAKNLVSSLGKPEDVFSDGTFAPGTVGPVGFTLVEFMIENGGGPKFSSFLAELQSGKDTAAAMQAVYKANVRDVAAAYVAAVKRSR